MDRSVFTDYRSISVLGVILVNAVILGLGSQGSILRQADVKSRHVLNDQLTFNSSVFFEQNSSENFQCFGPIYEASKIYEQSAHLRKKYLFPRVVKLKIDNNREELYVISNVFSFEEVQTVGKELSLIGLFYFAARFEDGYKIYIDLPDAEGSSVGVSLAKLGVFESMGRHLETVLISRPEIFYLLILEGVDEKNNALQEEKRCKGIA